MKPTLIGGGRAFKTELVPFTPEPVHVNADGRRVKAAILAKGRDPVWHGAADSLHCAQFTTLRGRFGWDATTQVAAKTPVPAKRSRDERST